LRNGLSLGSLALLTGCDLSTHSRVDAALWAMLRFDDRVQAALFNPQRLAETYPASAITRLEVAIREQHHARRLALRLNAGHGIQVDRLRARTRRRPTVLHQWQGIR